MDATSFGSPSSRKSSSQMTTILSIVAVVCTLAVTNAAPAKTVRGIKCEALQQTELGSLTMPCLHMDCTATVVCAKGFWYTGTVPRVCLANGTWSGVPGHCKAVLCPELRDPPHGRFNQNDRSYDAVATVECDEGYFYSRPNTNRWRCMGDNTWELGEGDCEPVSCPRLLDPQNGEVLRGYLTSYQANVSIQCNNGYTYSAAANRTCQGNNTWSGQEGICKRVSCLRIKPIDHDHGVITGTGHQYRDTVTLQCQPGYSVNGPSIITCKANGTWSSTFGYCTAVIQSDKLLVAVLVPVLFVVVAVTVIAIIGLLLYRKHQHGYHESDAHETEQPLLSGKDNCLHCSLTWKKDGSFEHHLATSDIRDGIQQVILTKLNIKVDVSTVTICLQIGKAFIDIRPSGMTLDSIDCANIRDAISQAHISLGNIVKESIKFREKVTHYLMADIHEKLHIPDKKPDKSINFETQYVKLKILSHEEMGAMQVGQLERPDIYQQNLEGFEGLEIQDEELVKDSESQKYVLIRGRAGIGKTTLVQRLLWKWASGEWATKFKAVFLLNLRFLMTIDRKMDLPHLLCLYAMYNTSKAGISINADWLDKNEENVGIVLDGIDEIPNFRKHWQAKLKSESLGEDANPLDWCLAIMQRSCLKKSTLIVSSRPFAALRLIGKEMKKASTYMMVEVMGLTRERVTSFVEKNVTPNRYTFVKETLENNPILMSVSSITFYCAALCQLLEKHDQLPDRFSTYTQITAYIMQMYMLRSVHDKTSMEELYKTISPHLRGLSQLAYSGIIDLGPREVPRLVFQDSDIEKISPKYNSNGIGLLMQTEIPDPDAKGQVKVLSQFEHLSIQEFLAMAGLLTHQPERVEETLNRLSQSEQFGMALLFLYGLAFNMQDGAVRDISTAIVGTNGEKRQVTLEVLKKQAVNVVDELQALQIAHESQSKDIAQSIGSEKFKEEVFIQGTKLTLLDIQALIFLLNNHPATHGIRLEHVSLDDLSIKELAKFMTSNKSVKAIKIFDNSLNDRNMEALMEGIGHNNYLQILDLTSDALRDTGVEKVAGAVKDNIQIISLTLNGKHVTDEGVEAISHAMQDNKKLERVSLYFPKMTDKGVIHVANTLTSNALQQLYLTSNHLTDHGVKAVADALRENQTIKQLRLDSKLMTDGGVQQISAALTANSQVQKLILHSPEITSEGVAHVSRMLAKNKHLTELSLLGFHVDEKGARTILQALRENHKVNLRMWKPLFCSNVSKELEAIGRIQLF